MITGGRAPSCVPAPLPLSHQLSVRWTCCYLFSLSCLCLSQLFHTARDPSTVHSTAPLLLHHQHHKKGRLWCKIYLAGKLRWREGEKGKRCFHIRIPEFPLVFSRQTWCNSLSICLWCSFLLVTIIFFLSTKAILSFESVVTFLEKSVANWEHKCCNGHRSIL